MNQRSYSRAGGRASSLGAALCVVIAALIIGCGGSGGGGGGGTSATTSNPTTSNPTTSNPTTSNPTTSNPTTTSTSTTSTATSSGSTGNGILPPNVLVYADAVTGPTLTYNVQAVNPDGTNPHTLVSGVPSTVAYFAANPIVKNEYVFAAQPAGNASYGIYVSTNGITLTGATQLVAPSYAGVESLQITEDATKIVYVGLDAAGDGNVYVESISGGTPTELDDSNEDYFADVSPGDSNTVVWSEFLNGAGQLFYKKISAGASGKATQLTNDAYDDEDPVFTHDGTGVVFNKGITPSGGLEVSYPTLLTMSSGAETTMVNPGEIIFDQASPNTGATFVGYAGEATATGIYTQATTSTAKPTLILNDAAVNTQIGVYWTGNNGRALNMNLSLGSKRGHAKASLRAKSIASPAKKRW